MKIKNCFWLVLVVGLIGTPSMAQRPTTLTATERVSALDTTLATTCSQKAMATAAPRVLAHNAQVFSPNRVSRTLNGVWIGKVVGDYDPQLLTRDGSLNVDYYMIVDTRRGEAFVYEEFGDKRSGADLKPKAGAPVWSYTWCARENYQSKAPRQVHTFTKVSDNVEDAREVLNNSLGLRLGRGDRVVLSEIWKRLVEEKYFDDPKKSLGYAGALFKPLTMGSVASAAGGSLLELRMVGEYRGIGETAAKFIPGEPIHNVEMAHFLGVSNSRAKVPQGALLSGATAGSGDFLTSAASIGNAMVGPKSDAAVAVFSTQMSFDKVVIGPLAGGGPANHASSRKPKR
jgi:hypothetical protein